MIDRTIHIFIVVFCIIIGVFVLRISPLQGMFEKAVHMLIQPVLSSGYALKSKAYALFDRNAPNRQTVDDLKAEIQRLQIENERYKQFESENDTLRSQLEFSKIVPHKPIAAHIVGSSDELGSHVFVLDKGLHDGVTIGSAVIAQEGIFVGTISGANEFTSFLRLPNDDRSSIIVSIFKDKKELSGIAHGRFKIGVLVDKVQQTVALAEGDTVVTSALNNVIPSGLIIGKVREILSTQNDLFQEATVTPVVSYESLRIVGIVTK